MHHTSLFRRLASIVVAIAATLLVVLTPSSASAARISSSQGSPGSIWMRGPLITATDANVTYGYGLAYYQRYVSTAGVTVQTSPASVGTQTVLVMYSLQTPNQSGQWVEIQQQRHLVAVARGGSYTSPAWNTSVQPGPGGTKGYRMVVLVAWADAAGRALGAAVVVPSTTADNRCAVRFLSCSSYSDGLRF